MFMFSMLRDGRRVSRTKVAHVASIWLLACVAVDVVNQDFLGAECFSAAGKFAFVLPDLQVDGSHVSTQVGNGIEGFPADTADPVALVT